MSDKKYTSEDVYRIITNDITTSVQRYFAPVVGLIHGLGESIGTPAAHHPWQHKEVERRENEKKEPG